MRLGAYETVRELGRGGASVVYRARAPGGSDVAVKVIAVSTKEDRDRFERERRLHATLGEAQGFVPLLDSGTAREGFFLVMPLLESANLRDRLKHGPLSIAEARRLGVALAQAIGRAHALGIVHRDLKPENVLFSSSGEPLVADLGVAKHWVPTDGSPAPSLNLSATGETWGTIGYMSREQMFEPATVGAPADVFALGAILYECLTGTNAFGRTPVEILKRIDGGGVTPVREHRPEVPAWFARAVERALARDAKDRFEDGSAFARALDAGEPTKPAKPAKRPTSRATRVRLGAALALAGVVALTTLLVVLERRADAEKSARLVEAHALEDEATRLGAIGDNAGALTALTRAVALDATSARMRRERAFLLGVRGDRNAALTELARSLELDPSAAETWRVRAVIRASTGDAAGAASDLDQALALDPKSAEAWKDRGDQRAAKHDLEGAVADYSRALEIDPKVAATWFARARQRIAERDWKCAVTDLDQAIELDPKPGTALNDRASVLMIQGDYPSALTDLQRASELLPDNASVLCNRGIAKRHLGDLAGARVDLDRAISFEPRFLAALVERARVELDLLDTDAAVTDATRALEIEPANATGWRLLCQAQFARHDVAATLHAFTELVQVEPSLAWARRETAPEGTEAARGETLASDAGLKPILDVLSHAYVDRAAGERNHGDLQAALLDFHQALKLDPMSLEASAGLAVVKAVVEHGGVPR